jgi:hypothetical protein
MEVMTTNQLTTKFTRSKQKNDKKIERERERERTEAEDFGCLWGNLMRGILFKICPSPPIIAFFYFTFLSSLRCTTRQNYNRG